MDTNTNTKEDSEVIRMSRLRPTPEERAQLVKFTEDDIRRRGLPRDVMELVHDLCYHHDGRDVYSYVTMAQEILKRERYDAKAKKIQRERVLNEISRRPGVYSRKRRTDNPVSEKRWQGAPGNKKAS